ncbi:hypothetical protein ACWGQT_07340 [Streptomyces yangpuensis]
MAERRMLDTFAGALHGQTQAIEDRLSDWQNANPNVADYRVEEARRCLRRAATLLGYLRDNTDPEGDAARAELRRKGFFGSEKPTTQDLVEAAAKVLTAAGYTEVVEPADHTANGFLVEARNDGRTVYVYDVANGRRVNGSAALLDYYAALETAGYTGADNNAVPTIQKSTDYQATHIVAFPPAQD